MQWDGPLGLIAKTIFKVVNDISELLNVSRFQVQKVNEKNKRFNYRKEKRKILKYFWQIKWLPSTKERKKNMAI